MRVRAEAESMLLLTAYATTRALGLTGYSTRRAPSEQGWAEAGRTGRKLGQRLKLGRSTCECKGNQINT